MNNKNFFAMISRMKYVNRWGLMRSAIPESIAEHSLEVSMIAHALAVINNVYFNGNVNPNEVVVAAMYHDVPEIITGDLPTPVKYFTPEIRAAYKVVEDAAIDKLVESLPDEMRAAYSDALIEENRSAQCQMLVKAADKISALIKCVEERRMGNSDFLEAEKSTMGAIRNLKCMEADYFLDNFLETYSLTVDEQA